MNRKNSVRPNSWSFEISGGKIIKAGKSQWPDVINLIIPCHHAWDLVECLINQLRQENLQYIGLAYCGELKEIEE